MEYINGSDVISYRLVFVNKLLWNILACSGHYCCGFSLTDLSRLTSPKNWFLHNTTLKSPRLAPLFLQNTDWLFENILRKSHSFIQLELAGNLKMFSDFRNRALFTPVG